VSAHLAATGDVIRVSLHVLAASVWVGGQFVMAGLVPTARDISPEAPRALARTFGRLSWPAFAVLLVTGVWNVIAAHPTTAAGVWHVALDAKVLLVVLAGVGAWRHTRATSAAQRGAWAGVSALASLVALVLGVALAG
jgi:uncharacterized membrane protein